MDRSVKQRSGRLLSRFFLHVCCYLMVAGAVQAVGPSQAEGAADLANRVNVKRVVKVFITKTTPAYSIEFEYKFPDRTKVHIQNIGIASASGHFNYLTTDDSLMFRDADSGAMLTNIRLRETITSAAKPPLNEIANETDFPAAYRSYRWQGHEGLPLRANSVLGKYFRYRPSERDGRTFIMTTFSPLEVRGVREGILGQIAVLVSFPYDAATDTFDFHVQSLVREGRTHSDEFRPTSNPMLIRAADAFIDNLVAEIQRGGQI
jgi:hypothetical protein